MWDISEINDKLNEYIYIQMLNLLRFLLNVNEIVDNETKSFDDLNLNIDDLNLNIDDNIDPNKRSILWYVILSNFRFAEYNPGEYTSIFSAYCRKYNIATKKNLYIHMHEVLKPLINNLPPSFYIDIFVVGMSINANIYDSFVIIYDNFGSYSYNYLKHVMYVLSINNWNGTQLSFDRISKHPINVEIKYDDPLQQIFYSKFIEYATTALAYAEYYDFEEICDYEYDYDEQHSIQDIITEFIDKEFKNKKTPGKIYIYVSQNDILPQHIPQYPPEIEPYLIIIKSLPKQVGFQKFQNILKLAKLAELSGYDLSEYPVTIIDLMLPDITFDQLPDFYRQISHRYSGSNTKAAPRE